MPVFGEQRTAPLMNSEGSGTRFYSDSEIDLLIEDLTEAAREAIEQAAAEAARAEALDGLEREGAALGEAARLQVENSRLKGSRVTTVIVVGVVCFFGGLAIGAGTTAILVGR
jgi:hypothetical protein